MNNNFNSEIVKDALSNLLIDISKVIKDTESSINNQEYDASELKYDMLNNLDASSFSVFYSYLNYFMNYAHNLYSEYYVGNVNGRYISEKIISIMPMIIEIRNKYPIDGIGYKTFNSLLDIFVESFTKIHS